MTEATRDAAFLPATRLVANFLGTALLVAGTLALLAIAPAGAQAPVLNCKPYVHGELRTGIPTFFCTRKEDALAVFELIEQRRKGTLSREGARERMFAMRELIECLHVAPSHVSRHTLRQGSEDVSCGDTGQRATLWPSLVEGELSGDGAKIWIITNALVPPPEK